LAALSFTATINNNRLATVSNEVVGSIQLAHSEAVKRRETVTICGSSNTTSCNTSNWESGWLVFLDVDKDGVVDVGDTIVHVNDGVNVSSMRSSAFSNSGYIQYNLTGSVDSAGTFTVCDSRGVTSARAININATERPRMATDGGDSGAVVENISGNNVTCGS